MWPREILLDLASQRLALALLHFLWQGALIAAIYSLAVEWLIRRPQRRYAAGVLALGVMAACLPITYWLVEGPDNSLRVVVDRTSEGWPIFLDDDDPVQYALLDDQLLASTINPPAPHGLDSSTDSFALGGVQSELTANPSADRNELYGRIVVVWLVGVIAFSLRLVGGAVGLLCITKQTLPAPREIENLMERFGRAMRLCRLPRLAVSSRVSEAIASGFFRPVIVFPTAWLAELPPSVIEAVLAHELAHVRRYDLWVNLLQRAVEAVLFFHPAVWWISRQVRGDREMCCDELAVAATGQKVAYVSALEVVARRAAREPLFSLATGIGGRKMQLLARVRHILGLPAQRQPGGWWAACVLALAVPCGLWALSGPTASRAVAQEERDEGDRDRDEREDQEERERDEREAREEQERDERAVNQERAERERDEAERNEREVRREIEIRRDREVRERGDQPRREGDRPEARDPGPRASAEAQRQRALQRVVQARQRQQQAQQQQQQQGEQQQQQARRQLERARQQLERQMAEMRERLGERMRGAEERGEREVVEAVRREMEAANRQAEDQVRTLERQREDLAARFRGANQERAEAERSVAEQERMAAMQSRGDEERQLVREMAAMVKELRQEVQQLRREVRELREGATRKETPKKDPQPKGEASLILESVPYVGRLFPNEKQPKKADPKPKVSVDFDGKKVESGKVKLELKLEGNDLQNLQKDLEKLQKVYADQIKSAEIEFEKAKVKTLKDVKVEFDNAAVKKIDDVKVELKKSPVEKIKDVQIEFNKSPIEKVKDVEIEFTKEPVKVKDVEVEFNKTPVKLKDVEIEFKQAPVKKIKNIEIEIKKAAVEKLKDAELALKKHYVAELKDAELALKKSLEKIKTEDLKALKEKIVSDVDVQYAAKAAEVAKRDLEKALEAVRQVPGVVSEIDIDRMKVTQKRALLELERAKREILERTTKLKDDLKKQDFQQELDKRLSELKRMVELSVAKEKIVTDKEPEKVIKKAPQ